MLVIDWLMTWTSGRAAGVEWILGEHLEDIDYDEDLALLPVSKDDAQEKIVGGYEKSQKT